MKKVNFIEIIDKELNNAEFYLKTRFEGIGFINKSAPGEFGHLTVTPSLNNILKDKMSISFTTVLGPVTHIDYEGKTITELALSLPRSNDDYKKTWGKSTLIMARFENRYFYLDAQHLLTFLDECLSTFEYSYRRGDVVKNLSYDRRKLIAYLPLQDLYDLGILVMEDQVINCADGSTIVFIKKNDFDLPLPKHFQKNNSCPLKKDWPTATPDDKKAWWKSFTLKQKYADRSKGVTIITEQGNITSFKSAALAAIELSTALHETIDPMCITHCLKGRQKSVITSKGKFTAVYEGESTDVMSRFAKRGK